MDGLVVVSAVTPIVVVDVVVVEGVLVVDGYEVVLTESSLTSKFEISKRIFETVAL